MARLSQLYDDPLNKITVDAIISLKRVGDTQACRRSFCPPDAKRPGADGLRLSGLSYQGVDEKHHILIQLAGERLHGNRNGLRLPTRLQGQLHACHGYHQKESDPAAFSKIQKKNQAYHQTARTKIS